jgi:hypothetical protein
MKATAWRRHTRPYRWVEAAALVMLLIGLASAAWLLALAGLTLMVGCYALYRRRHGAVSLADNAGMGMGDGGD